MSSGQVLARRVGAGLWQQQEWSNWARQSVQKAILPVEEARKAEKHKVKRFVSKRAQKRPATQKAHSTPFTLPRSEPVYIIAPKDVDEAKGFRIKKSNKVVCSCRL